MSEQTMNRANKVTAYWEGDGIAVGVFYKTHTKLATVRSNDQSVLSAGFTMPEGTDEAPGNAAVFGIQYDPVDRRDDTYKFPSHYDEVNVLEFSKKMLTVAIEKVLGSIQTNVVDRMVKAGNLPGGSMVQYGVGDGNVAITEKYGNGYIKYATITYPVVIAVGDKQTETSVTVDLVSGQIKKPRTIGDTVMTMSGVKDLLVAADVLPKVEKKSKKEDTAEGGDTPADAPADAPAEG